MLSLVKRWLVAAAFLSSLSALAGPVTVSFERQDIADTAPGTDLWMHRYTISGPLDAFSRISLLFSPEFYANLEMGDLGNPDLEQMIIQPDAGLLADGLLQIGTLIDLGEDFSLQFNMQFARVGNLPMNHGFEVLDPDFNVAYTGTAINQSAPQEVDEPSSLPLVVLALGLAVVPFLPRPRKNDALPTYALAHA
jgi:hypothetical protein